jgi:hypothetical protein
LQRLGEPTINQPSPFIIIIIIIITMMKACLIFLFNAFFGLFFFVLFSQLLVAPPNASIIGSAFLPGTSNSIVCLDGTHTLFFCTVGLNAVFMTNTFGPDLQASSCKARTRCCAMQTAAGPTTPALRACRVSRAA